MGKGGEVLEVVLLRQGRDHNQLGLPPSRGSREGTEHASAPARKRGESQGIHPPTPALMDGVAPRSLPPSTSHLPTSGLVMVPGRARAGGCPEAGDTGSHQLQ